MLKQQYTINNFPKWAIVPLINGDFTGLDDSADDLVMEFLSDYSDVITWDIDYESLEGENFNNYPLFGLATDCCTIHGYIKE